MRKLFLLFLFFTAVLTYGQSFNPFNDLKIEYPALNDNLSYAEVVLKLKSYRPAFFDMSNKTDYRSFYYQIISTPHSFINDYESVLRYLDSAGIVADGTDDIQKILENDSNIFSFNSILSSFTDTVRSVFINEAHQIAKHRILTTLFLQPLYNKGFRYLFLEGLSKIDSSIKFSGIPLISPSPYIREPLFADMIRQAVKIGYKILPFDYSETKPANFTLNTRDSMMAVNIARIYETDPSAKILVHAGWAHIQENSTMSWNTMGNFYKKFTGINPLSIDQTSIIELNFFSSEKNKKRAKELSEKITRQSFYFKDGLIYDLIFLSTDTKYINGRPDWLSMNGYRNVFELDEKTLKGAEYNTLVQAFYKNEYIQFNELAVPVDQFLIKSVSDRYSLIIPDGEYVIRVLSSDKKIISEFDISFKH